MVSVVIVVSRSGDARLSGLAPCPPSGGAGDTFWLGRRDTDRPAEPLDEAGRPLKLPPYDFGLSVALRDIDGDGNLDIYVCNDLFPPDRIWLGDGHGRFRAMSNLAVRNT